MVANPQADIADVYAWMSGEGQRLNLALTIQGHAFSDRIDYAIHIDSGKSFGHTSESVTIICKFASADAAVCRLGNIDSVSGDLTNPSGIEGRNRRFRVYAGTRDDPFYNNIKGLLGAYKTANDAIKRGGAADAAGCHHFDTSTVEAIRSEMTHTDGGAAQNFLATWTVGAIVVSVDVSAVSRGGKLLAVWGSTSAGGRQLDRMARPFVTNTLLGESPFSPDDVSGRRRQEYNEAQVANGVRFVGDLQRSLAFQDALDGKCGNQLLAGATESPARYLKLAKVFADDRLWVNTASNTCTQFFAVELAALDGRKMLSSDCGGRSPTYDAPNMWRSLLIAGTVSGVTDGLQQDEHPPSASVFPFLAPPDAHAIDH